MRHVMIGWCVVAVCIALGAADAQAQQRSDRPNVIVIVADDMGYGDIGVHGCRDIPTPHIDSLAAQGVRCTNGYVSHPFCSPTRAGLMTGRYQQRFGHEFNPGPATNRTPGIGLPLNLTTMADRMKAAGYRTGLVGKWHLGHVSDEYHPFNRGFEEFFGFLGGSHSYLRPGSGHTAILRGHEEVQEKEYLTDAFAREGVAFIERHKAEPFFLLWTFNAVHGPMEGDEQYMERFASIKDPKRRTYATMLASMDDAIGMALDKLRDLKLEERTLIFFISDNGGPEAVNASDNGPFNGSKGDMYEGGIRSPFLVQWKGHLPAGKTYDRPVISLDILPTMLAAAGVEAGADAKFDGVNLLPYLRGENTAAPHEALYWRSGPKWAIRMGDWKLMKNADDEDRAGKATLEGAMLFNLAQDIGEQKDLASSQPRKLKELSAKWQAWNGQLAEPLWGPPNRGKKKAGKKGRKDRD